MAYTDHDTAMDSRNTAPQQQAVRNGPGEPQRVQVEIDFGNQRLAILSWFAQLAFFAVLFSLLNHYGII